MSDPPQFDSFAAGYQSALHKGLQATGESSDYFARGRIRYLTRHLNRLNFHPANILDFGCGTGASIPLLQNLPTANLPAAKKIIGIDVSAESLKIAAQNNPSAQFQNFNDPLPAGSIDLAFCNGVFHHIPPPNRPASIQLISSALRPGGLFALWENNPLNPGTRHVMSRIPFDRDAITLSPPHCRRMLRSAGFEILLTRFLFFFPRQLRWLRRAESLLTRIPLGGQYLVLCRKPPAL